MPRALHPTHEYAATSEPDSKRRDFLTAGLILAGTVAIKAQEKVLTADLRQLPPTN